MSTFSKLRVGKKPYAAGSATLTLIVDAGAVADGVAMLPPGAVVLGANSDNVVAADITDGTTTTAVATTVAGTPDPIIIPAVIAGAASVDITTAVAGKILVLTYMLNDDTNGANG